MPIFGNFLSLVAICALGLTSVMSVLSSRDWFIFVMETPVFVGTFLLIHWVAKKKSQKFRRFMCIGTFTIIFVYIFLLAGKMPEGIDEQNNPTPVKEWRPEPKHKKEVVRRAGLVYDGLFHLTPEGGWVMQTSLKNNGEDGFYSGKASKGSEVVEVWYHVSFCSHSKNNRFVHYPKKGEMVRIARGASQVYVLPSCAKGILEKTPPNTRMAESYIRLASGFDSKTSLEDGWRVVGKLELIGYNAYKGKAQRTIGKKKKTVEFVYQSQKCSPLPRIGDEVTLLCVTMEKENRKDFFLVPTCDELQSPSTHKVAGIFYINDIVNKLLTRHLTTLFSRGTLLIKGSLL